MARSGRDNERSPEDPTLQPKGAGTGGSSDRIRELPDRLTPGRHTDITEREHHLALPSGPDRESIQERARAYHLRGSEVDILERAACFRSVFTDDLRRTSGDESRAD